MNNDLISRSALKEAIRARVENDNNEDFDKGYNIALQGVIELIDNAPTVELTELCKGCQYLKDCETCDKNERPKGDKDEYNCFHCKYASKPAYEEPCNKCKHSYDNKFEWDMRGEDNG